MTPYKYTNPENTWIMSSDGHHFPVWEGNRFYAEFLASGAVAADYVAPSAPPAPLTPAEKLAAAGLTVEELKALLTS